MSKIVDKIFLVLFFSLLILPLIYFNNISEAISESENRTLSDFPQRKLLIEKKYNEYMEELETWFNDRVGFRDKIISSRAYLDFKLFDKIDRNSFYIGRGNTLVYSNKKMIESFSKEKISKNDLDKYVESYIIFNNYIVSKGIQFYYIPCYDKQYIYSDNFIKNVNLYGTKSKKELIIEELNKFSEIKVVDFKQELIDAKKKYLVYGDWSDPTHWTARGAYIAYLKIMDEVRENNISKNIPILQEDDYDLSIVEKGYNLNGNYYYKDKVEKFEIKKPKATITSKKILGKYQGDYKHVVYENNEVNNGLRLLIIGDSYSRFYLLDDFAESFSNVAMVYNTDLNLEMLNDLIKSVNPDIVFFEEAQRLQMEDKILELSEDIIEFTK